MNLLKYAIKFFSQLLLIVIAIVAIYGFYLWNTYIDESTVQGSAYGFAIGETKEEVYKKAPSLLFKLSSNNMFFTMVKVDSGSQEILATRLDFPILTQTLLHEVGYERFKLKNTWEFYFEGSFSDSLRLKFCDEILCEIYRHRQYFELP